ncbi:MAG: LemA family protein [Micavibrio aeruginosavorus]|uniref:LemA family protein n=1 Tax=Micavibrio aeruginosavorus TaxID=349221 RepID=A0A7T5R4N5_9BACT|nr:MAG: LemA family protein [Micavibrio aeruginosavorus]
MNKSLSSVISIALISLPLIGSLIWFALCYNGLVNKEEDVLASWAQVESNYQRRADLIPNLVSSVKTYIEHENQTMTDIARLRSQADTVTQENAKAQEIGKDAVAHLNDEAYMTSLAKAQQNLGGQVRNLMLAVESYPALRSSDQFMQLQAQLEGTENRINVARMAFNEAVGTFNSSIRRMPGSLIAGMGNFQRKAYFKADEEAAAAPRVSFEAPAQDAAQ